MTTPFNYLLTVPVLLVGMSPWVSTLSAADVGDRDSATRINAANALIREGKAAEAVANLQQIQVGDADRDLWNYNLGVAEYRTGNIDQAKAHFKQSAASNQSPLAARSRYNLGNCFYSDAVSLAEKDKPAAIESLREAIGHYRGSLSTEPNNSDARANIELAAELMKRLQSEQQSNQQQQDRQQDQQQDQQQDRAQQDQQEKEQQEQGQQEQDQEKQEQGQQQQQQQDQQKQEQQGQQAQGEQGDDQQREEPVNSTDQNRNAQSQKKPDSKSSESDSQEEPSSQDDETPQQPKIGELTAADEQDAGENVNRGEGADESNAEVGLMTKEEALKMLQAVRDRDMLRRMRREQLQRSRHIPTERDW